MNFGFLFFPNVEELDVIGPWEMIGIWSKYFAGPEHCFTISQTGGEVRCAKGLTIQADVSFATCPPLDYILVPGGQGTRQEVDNPTLINFLRNRLTSCRHILSVCTGAFLLQAAGLLHNKQATTHWKSLERLRKCADVTVIEGRFVRDGNIWTASGISAGIDLALAFIADQAGEETAGKVQLAAEYYPQHITYGTASRIPEAPSYVRCSQKVT